MTKITQDDKAARNSLLANQYKDVAQGKLNDSANILVRELKQAEQKQKPKQAFS